MKDLNFKSNEQAEVERLARTATGPAVGESPFWAQVMKHLDAIGDEHPVVKPRPKKD